MNQHELTRQNNSVMPTESQRQKGVAENLETEGYEPAGGCIKFSYDIRITRIHDMAQLITN